MALRGCVILLFVLLSGSVYADDMAMTLAPGMQEPSTSQIPTVTQTGSPSSSAAPTATTPPTTEAQTTMTTKAQTTMTTKAQTTMTTEAPTTHKNTTNSTTEAPTTTHHIPTTEPPTTPHHNTTNSTTEAPTTAHTNATTSPTPPPTTPPVPKPTVGNYSVRPDVNSSICLLAKMGLQFSFTTSGNASRQTINVDPNVTLASGTCGSGGSDSSLVLKSDKITVHFVFTNVSEKFRMHALVLSIDIGQGSFFNESNTNLSLWEASVGSSYMCRKEQTYNISDKLTINTFELQVQPFAVKKDTFSTAHECSMDDISLLIPIIVGAVLAGLIFIVVIAYVIGRRRTYVGYQTL
ncbi:lysosome-associated membrane glycoprotein 2 isoform X2 [Triplophysa rosa]|uniref:Lysosome-associated membrane glycoprotein 2 n=1 Tax=Triplophysa rosa TaxID=992332 RepID=A0A9W7TR19_TRIRA|nr:lysosome-associated membrane glycoprotein 2 isoform X2 [Triplophysa rosa]KAI7801897.1 lysosome-associated membrane glycoprotein 2 precursor [Triplophysa rosa]